MKIYHIFWLDSANVGVASQLQSLYNPKEVIDLFKDTVRNPEELISLFLSLLNGEHKGDRQPANPHEFHKAITLGDSDISHPTIEVLLRPYAMSMHVYFKDDRKSLHIHIEEEAKFIQFTSIMKRLQHDDRIESYTLMSMITEGGAERPTEPDDLFPDNFHIYAVNQEGEKRLIVVTPSPELAHSLMSLLSKMKDHQ